MAGVISFFHLHAEVESTQWSAVEKKSSYLVMREMQMMCVTFEFDCEQQPYIVPLRGLDTP